MLKTVIVLLSFLTLTSSLVCYDCNIRWDSEGYRSIHASNGTRLRSCPSTPCPATSPQVACRKTIIDLESSKVELRGCSSLFTSSETLDYGTLEENIAAEYTCLRAPSNCTVAHCVKIDKCNGYQADAVTATPYPTRAFVVESQGVVFGLSLVPVIAIGVGVLALIIIVIVIGCCFCRRRKGEEGYEKTKNEEENTSV